MASPDRNDGSRGFLDDRDSRVMILGLLIVVLYAVYFYALYSIQIIDGKKYRTQAQNISSNAYTIPARRGEILERNARDPLVLNVDSFNVRVTPGEIPDGHYDTVAARLAAYLSISKFDIDRKITKSIRRSYTPVTIASNVPFEAITRIAENKTDLPGVSYASVPMRNYVGPQSLSHVLGYIGNITKEEINTLYNAGYNSNSIIGKIGIEKQYDALLQGVPGREINTIDVLGRIIDEPRVEPPQMGKNLVLTIDTRIQTLAEKALGNRVGAVVVLRPSTGEILAMVSYPYFDLNQFTTDASGEYYQQLIKDGNRPFVNRAVDAVYPPASTFKIVMSAAMLQEKVFSPAQKIECRGKMVYGGRTFHCHIPVPGHGWLDLKNGFAQSCDVYYWTVGRDYLGIGKIAEYAKDFGLGQSTEIDLPASSSGFVPNAEWKERRFHEKWLGGDTMSTSIGQGYLLATPLQLADMTAMVANGGVIYRPHLLKEVREPNSGAVIQEITPEVLFKSDIESDVWKEMQEIMRYSISDGTPQYPMHNKIVKAAGKTGTGEVAAHKKSWHSWMVAYAPYDAPSDEQVVVSTIVEAVNPWEWWAPYATNIILQGIFGDQTYDEAVSALGFNYLKKNGNRQE